MVIWVGVKNDIVFALYVHDVSSEACIAATDWPSSTVWLAYDERVAVVGKRAEDREIQLWLKSRSY